MRAAFVLRHEGKIVQDAIDLGFGTNNIAEYQALIHGLRAADAAGVTHLEVYGDSQIVINGMIKGVRRKGGAPHLEEMKKLALSIARTFANIEYIWVPREENAEADALTEQRA